MNVINLRYCLVCFCLLYASTTDAQSVVPKQEGEQPLWEAGIFAGAFRAPDYIASNRKQTNVIAAPYVIYRGETFRIGDGAAARAVAVENQTYELDLSIDGSFNASSDDNPARVGMPDLDYLFELGPQLTINLNQYDFGAFGEGKLRAEIQARAAFSSDFSSIHQRGYVFHPELSYRHRGLWGENTALFFSIAPAWATEDLHDYIYQEDPSFARNDRSAYDAKSGYLGTEVSLGIGFTPTQRLRLFIGWQVGLRQGAANEDSPLFDKDTTVSVGAGLVWRFYQSDKKVTRS